MQPKIELDFIELPIYTALTALGVIVGLGAAWLHLRSRSRRAARLDHFLDLALVSLLAGLVGARAFYILTDLEYFQGRPDEVIRIGLGGLALDGGLLLGILALALVARGRHLNFWLLADAGALGLCLGQVLGWAGALVNGAYYGRVSESQWAIELPDLYGLVQSRFPVQHVEIALFAITFLVLWVFASPDRSAGDLFLVYLVVTSFANAVLGFQRGEETAMVGGLRVDQAVETLLAFAGLVAIARRARGTRRGDLLENVG